MSSLTDQRSRVLALLGLTQDPDVQQTDPVPTAEDVDALDAIAFDWPGEQAHVTVLEFDDYDEAEAAQQQLRGLAGQTDLVVETTVNGDLLLWATAPADDARARARIDGLAQSFAGRE